MQTERVPISQIKPNPDNPRVIRDEKFAKLKKSIQDFPEMLELRPIVVDADGVILGGNMRFRAIQDLGMKEVAIVRADTLTPEQKREFIIKDNVGFGEWDYAALGKDWNLDELGEWGLEMPTEAAPEVEGDFEDEGIEGKNQYGVIVICESEGTQESTFRDLQGMGYNCKIVVT